MRDGELLHGLPRTRLFCRLCLHRISMNAGLQVIWYSIMSRSALLISQKRVNDHLVHLYLQSDAHSSPSVRAVRAIRVERGLSAKMQV